MAHGIRPDYNARSWTVGVLTAGRPGRQSAWKWDEQTKRREGIGS